MIPDYTIDDAWKDGFESGVLYILGYRRDQPLANTDISRLADFLELKKPWKSKDEWYRLLNSKKEG